MKKLSNCARIELGIDRMFAGKLWAYTAVTCGSYWALGIAVANERGYNPVPMHWAHVEMGPGAHEAMSAHADELNLERGISSDAAMRIVISTMGGRSIPDLEAVTQ